METDGKDLIEMIHELRGYASSVETAGPVFSDIVDNLIKGNRELSFQLEIMYKVFILLMLDTGTYEYTMMLDDVRNASNYNFVVLSDGPDVLPEDAKITFKIEFPQSTEDEEVSE